MRPASIRWFGAGYLVWLAATIGGEAWAVGARAARPAFYNTDPIVVVANGVIVAAHLGLNLALRHFIVARPRRIARTAFLALLMIYAVVVAYQLSLRVSAGLIYPFPVRLILPMLSIAVQFGLAWLLFRPDAEAWFGDQEATEQPEALEETFR